MMLLTTERKGTCTGQLPNHVNTAIQS